MTRTRLIAAAGGLFALAAAPAFAATATSGQVNANASAALVTSFSGLPGNVNTHGEALHALPDAISATALATASNGANINVSAQQSISASWNDANHGSFAVTSIMSETAFDLIPDQVIQATTIDQSLNRTLPTWQYAFDATGSDNLFSLDFATTVDGNFTGLGTWIVSITRDGQSVAFETITNGFGSGVFTQALDSGHAYVVNVLSNDGLAFVTDGRHTNSFRGNQTSVFDWTITGDTKGGGAVPEPSTWALTIAGFGLVGAALRRRQALLPA